jgi:dihydrofolate synthase/folylpolyglutamate synthase
MTYAQAVEYYEESFTKGAKAPAETFARALGLLGNPQDKLNVIHIAGTNGKGSVCALLDAVLRAAGVKTGLFTSPHLSRVNERFRLNGEEITDEAFADFCGGVKAVSEKLGVRFSYFQILTLMCFSCFKEAGADALILETGIGGRLDCTNVIKSPLLSVITRIGLDHTAILGDNIEKIAFEKAGIIKERRPAAVSAQRKEAVAVISSAAREKNARLYAAPRHSLVSGGLSGQTVRFDGFGEFFINLPGGFQAENAACALAALTALSENGTDVPAAAVRAGFAEARWPGRFEVIRQNPLIILDGAHNPDGAEALAVAVSAHLPGKRLTLVLGILSAKDCRAVLAPLLPLAESVVFTRPKNGARAAAPEALLSCVPGGCRAFAEDDFRAAARLAESLAGPEGAVVCAGSLYLIGDMRTMFMGDRL